MRFKALVIKESYNVGDINRQLDNLAIWMVETYPGSAHTSPAEGSITFFYDKKEFVRVMSELKSDPNDPGGNFAVKDLKTGESTLHPNIPAVKNRIRELLRSREIKEAITESVNFQDKFNSALTANNVESYNRKLEQPVTFTINDKVFALVVRNSGNPVLIIARDPSSGSWEIEVDDAFRNQIPNTLVATIMRNTIDDPALFVRNLFSQFNPSNVGNLDLQAYSSTNSIMDSSRATEDIYFENIGNAFVDFKMPQDDRDNVKKQIIEKIPSEKLVDSPTVESFRQFLPTLSFAGSEYVLSGVNDINDSIEADYMLSDASNTSFDEAVNKADAIASRAMQDASIDPSAKARVWKKYQEIRDSYARPESLKVIFALDVGKLKPTAIHALDANRQRILYGQNP